MVAPVRFWVVGSEFMGQTWTRVITTLVPEARPTAVYLMDAIATGRDPDVGRQGALTTSMLEATERSAATGQVMRIPLPG